jgi:hypothetical protein
MTELRSAPHGVLGRTVIEVWSGGHFIAAIYGTDRPGLRILSKYPMISQQAGGDLNITDLAFTLPATLTDDDDDEAQVVAGVAVDAAAGIVRLEFAAPVTWLALPAPLAREIGEALLEKADELERTT